MDSERLVVAGLCWRGTGLRSGINWGDVWVYVDWRGIGRLRGEWKGSAVRGDLVGRDAKSERGWYSSKQSRAVMLDGRIEGAWVMRL